ncbi:MAG TPA: helix-turn-helix transcriptional regulator [Pseudolabrys sp.]|nr:helix-turn-helix transcriptional regulator [Pseudolabrys sp.]
MRATRAAQLEQASILLGHAATDPNFWPQAMEAISRAANATGAALLQSDVRTPDIPRTASVDELFRQYFRDDWHVRDIRAARGVPLLLNGASVVVDQDLMTCDEVTRDPFYNDLLLRCGFKWFAGVGFRAGSALWGLTIQRTPKEGPFARDEKRILAALSQKLTAAASLSTLFGRVAVSSATAALSNVGQPAIAIDRRGLIIEMNAASQAVLDDEVRVKDRRLCVSDLFARNEIDLLVARLRTTRDAAALQCDPIVIRRKRGVPIVIRVLPVPEAAQTPFLGACAVLTLSPIEVQSGAHPVLLGKIFGLTSAEAKLASIVAEGVGPDGAADRLGISRATARNQLKAVFSKTGTHRQSELVALFSAI